VRLFILAGMLIAFGAYCFVDAYIRGRFPYPENGDLNDFIGYYLNHVGGIVLPILGLVPLVWAIVFLRRVLVADDEGIGYVGKDRIPWAAVQSLDTSKFAEKGILRLRYRSDGRDATLVLDRWKLRNFQPLVALVESKVAAGGQQG